MYHDDIHDAREAQMQSDYIRQRDNMKAIYAMRKEARLAHEEQLAQGPCNCDVCRHGLVL